MEEPPIRPNPGAAQSVSAFRILNVPASAMEMRQRGGLHELVTLPDLNQTIDEIDAGTAPNVNLISAPARNLPLITADSVGAADRNEPKIYSCNYCGREFYSTQALGGHQNAHKKERDSTAKRGGKTVVPTYSISNRSLGIQAHSSVHKPKSEASSSLKSSRAIKNSTWPKLFLKKQPEVGSIAPDNNNAGAVFGSSGSSAAPRLQNAASGSSMSAAPRFENLTMPASSGVITGVIWGPSLSHPSTKPDDLQKLDLTLKL